MKFFLPALLSALILVISSCGTKQPHTGIHSEKPVLASSKNQEPLDIFYISEADWAKGGEQVAFISLSDIHEFSEHPDSLPIPDISELSYDSIQYMELTGIYRKRFLEGSGVFENDKVFLYNYETGKEKSFPVKQLTVAACINIYVSENDMPFEPYYYEFGFGIDTALVRAFADADGYFENVLVFVGKESPFTGEPLEPIEWMQVDLKQFPQVKENAEVAKELKGFRPNETHVATIGSLDYYVQDGLQTIFDYESTSRHVVVLNNKTQEVVFERAYAHSEGISVAPLNLANAEYSGRYQWTGKLFKDRSPVVFGFYWSSFGCEPICFMGGEQKEFYVNCDNRH